MQFEEALRQVGEVGYVRKSIHSTVKVEGLPGAKLEEMVLFESGQMGQVIALGMDLVEVLVLSGLVVNVGERVTRLDARLTVPVGEGMLGQVVDVLGKSMWGEVGKEGGESRLVEARALGIVSRRKISRPLCTGVSLVDFLVPIGRGQRELVMGDRKTGKSLFLWQVLLKQAREGTVCVYACIGKRKQEVLQIREFLEKNGVWDKCVVVAASSHDSAGEIFLSPYTAMTVAEFFRDKGREVLVVLDDMSTHAKFYREISLLSRKFPGRDSYPGDIFHIHSKLLERAGNFNISVGDQEKEVAITCLPIVETLQGDMTGYIQTNLMSMTDGHIYFDNDLFFRGRRPAVNAFVSVTRVGYQTQNKPARQLARSLLDLLNNYEKTQTFLKFGAELGENSRQILALGDKVLMFFDQPMYMVVEPSLQIAMLGLLLSGLWDGRNLAEYVKRYEEKREFRELVDQAAASADLEELFEASRKVAGRLLGEV